MSEEDMSWDVGQWSGEVPMAYPLEDSNLEPPQFYSFNQKKPTLVLLVSYCSHDQQQLPYNTTKLHRQKPLCVLHHLINKCDPAGFPPSGHHPCRQVVVVAALVKSIMVV
ncbi:hypothetical protein F0562_016881 [Nyssa sinensis]|uniref:Uncharacterized protein n=1 Tax=Nyssa sinensis TaxID=561372 RepID=A0A5J4ZDA6_9ASTE|nr:hypothetical protein F0562_016881 [Nyssa sinensis]